MALRQNRLHLSEMNIGGGEKTEGGVVMLVVVPAEEFSRPGAGILLAAKMFRIIRSIFQGFKLRFRKRIVVGNVWTGVGLRDT